MIEHFPFPYTSLLKCLPKSKNTILIERINIRPETAGMLEVFGIDQEYKAAMIKILKL